MDKAENDPKFIKIKAPTQQKVEDVMKKIALKCIKLCRKIGYIEQVDQDTSASTGKDPYHEEESLHAEAMRASVKNRIVFGIRSGKKVQEIGAFIHQGFGYTKEPAVLQGDR